MRREGDPEKPHAFRAIKSNGEVMPPPRMKNGDDPLSWLWALKEHEAWVREENARIDAEEDAKALRAAWNELADAREAAPPPTPEQPERPPPRG